MAKSIFEHISALFNSPWPGFDIEPEPEATKSVSPDGMTGVERYLAKKAEQEAPQPTSVEKYLARHAQSKEPSSAMTGVEKYLAKQAASAPVKVTPVTGVEKYLARQAALSKQKPAKPVSSVDKYLAKKVSEKKNVEPSGVEKYLAKQTTPVKPAAVIVSDETEASDSSLEEPAEPQDTEQPETSSLADDQCPQDGNIIDEVEADKASETVELSEEAKIPDVIDLAENATQCQAATAKGTQCKRTTQLTTLERTINKQKYRFSVCSQHNTKNFKPFSGVVPS